MLWTYGELRQLCLVSRRFASGKAGISELKDEVRWLNKKLADRIKEVISGLEEEGSSPPTEEEIAELLEGEEPEVIRAVQDQYRRGENGHQTTKEPAEVPSLRGSTDRSGPNDPA